MQLKARALGLEAQDYRTDRVEDNDIRRTQRRSGTEEYAAIDIPGHSVQAFASQERITLPHLEMLLPNQYRPAAQRGGAQPRRPRAASQRRRIRQAAPRPHHHSRRPLAQAANLGQRFLLDALYDPDITLVTVYGKAGTGKMLLSVGATLEQVQMGEYEKMLITRVIMPTGRDIGFLPRADGGKDAAVGAAGLRCARPPAFTPAQARSTLFDKKKQSKRKKPTAPTRSRRRMATPTPPANTRARTNR